MEVIGASELRNNLKNILEKITSNSIEIIIKRPKKENLVILPFNEFNSLKETVLLLSSKANRDRLYLGLKQVSEGNTTKINIDEL